MYSSIFQIRCWFLCYQNLAIKVVRTLRALSTASLSQFSIAPGHANENTQYLNLWRVTFNLFFAQYAWADIFGELLYFLQFIHTRPVGALLHLFKCCIVMLKLHIHTVSCVRYYWIFIVSHPHREGIWLIRNLSLHDNIRCHHRVTSMRFDSVWWKQRIGMLWANYFLSRPGEFSNNLLRQLVDITKSKEWYFFSNGFFLSFIIP